MQIIRKVEDAWLPCINSIVTVGTDIDYMKAVVEYSDCLLYFTSQENQIDTVAFAFIKSKSKLRGKILDIVLASSAPGIFARMLVHSLCEFAYTHKYPFLYVSPKTAELREVFIEQGFESIHGIEGVDELLEKEIDFE
jgi:hypothetical protein